jgi:osmoprotectant transport system ATP-binding protein
LAVDPPLMLMDEPFGAIDPINRGRLQNQFLRLQEQIRKTVVFVTHDIDEALKMGDRIAVMKEGGVLAQYATPQELLQSPADAFVESFVGADRGLKELALHTIRELELGPVREGSPVTIEMEDTLRDALSAMLVNDADYARVRDSGPNVVGTITIDQIREVAK